MSGTSIPPEKVSVRRQVQEMLMAEDRFSFAGSLGLLLWGLLGCLVMATVTATLLHFITGQLFEERPIGWFGWFIAFWVVLIPIVIWQERKGHKEYVLASLDSEDLHVSSTGEAAVVGFHLGVGTITDMLVWGPRRALEGLAGMRGNRSPTKKALFKRASQMVVTLAKEPGGIGIKLLMRPPENMAIFTASLDWLDRHDYIGRSSDGERIWIGTIGRKKLASHGIAITPKLGLDAI
jgi:hypothetical protein